VCGDGASAGAWLPLGVTIGAVSTLSHPLFRIRARALVSLRHGDSEIKKSEFVDAAALLSPRSSLRSEVIDAGRRISLDMHAFVMLLVEFDLSGEWAFDGSPSCAHWVAERVDTELCTVREWLRIGHALSDVGEIERRFADGRLSYSKVRTLTRVADADNQHELCAIAERVPAGRLAMALAQWLNRNESPDARERRHLASTRLSWHVEPDGMVAGSFGCRPRQPHC
jgi:hypothetical protein